MTRLFLFVACLTVAACVRPAEVPAPANDPVSGLDPAAFDRSVRPQDDLFHHVNGAWLAKTEIPADKASYGAFDILFDKAQEDLRGIVEEAGKSATRAAGSDAQKIGDFYASFMNEARVEELGLAPMKAELEAIDAMKTKSDVARHFARFFKLSLINPMVGYVDGDAQQPTHDILYVYQGGLGLPDRDYYIKNDDKLKEYREKYVALVTTLLKLAGDGARQAREVQSEDRLSEQVA
jgi:putative endopeptidase